MASSFATRTFCVVINCIYDSLLYIHSVTSLLDLAKTNAASYNSPAINSIIRKVMMFNLLLKLFWRGVDSTLWSFYEVVVCAIG